MKKLYFGGPILTMEPSAPRADALLTDGARILALGDRDALQAAAPDAEPRELGGAALLPAFIDPHSHFSQVASGFLQVSLAGVTDPDELDRRVRAFASGHPEGWLFARGFDPTAGCPVPTLAALDAMAGGRPLAVQYASGHMGLFSTAALAALGVTEKTPDPAGGRIGRENGRLTGYLEEKAYFDALSRAPGPSLAELTDGYRRAQALYFSHGIATVQEGMFVPAMLPMYRALLASGELALDLRAYPTPAALPEVRQAFPDELGPGAGRLRFPGLKIFLDGSPQGRTAWMRADYEGEPGYCGYGTMDDGAVLDAMVLAAEEKLQLLAHCNGDAAAGQFLRCLAKAEARFPVLRELRPVLIHAQLLGPDQLPRVRELGAMCSFFPAHVWYWGDEHLKNFGETRARHCSPAASALRAGVPFTFHQDSPVVQPDMLETVWCAVCRVTKAGVLLGPEERIPAAEALRAVTAAAARQYFEENDKGTLAPGKRADLVILSRDPTAVPPEQIREIRVLETVRNGGTVYVRE